MMACFGNRALVSPLVSQIPSFAAKTASALNPMVFAASHPKFREALGEYCPCFGIGVDKSGPKETDTQMKSIKSDS